MALKLSVAIADNCAAPDAFVVWRGFEESIRKARKFGFDGVELALREKEEVDTKQLDNLLLQNDLTVSCISTGQVFSAMKLYMTHPDEAIRRQTIHVFCDLIDLATDFGQMVNIGRARGGVNPGQTSHEAKFHFTGCLEKISNYAEKKKVQLVIEPVNRYELNFINTLNEGSDLIDEYGINNNIGLMPDTFHMNIEEVDISRSIYTFQSKIKYFHLADSNRLAPGMGHLDFEKIFTALHSARYDGWVTVEILPLPNPDEAAKQAVDYLHPYLEKYRAESQVQ